MTPDLLKWAASLGVGGILAAGMFWVHRHDMRETQDRLVTMQQNTVILAGRLLDAVETLSRHTALLECLARKDDGQMPPPKAWSGTASGTAHASACDYFFGRSSRDRSAPPMRNLNAIGVFRASLACW